MKKVIALLLSLSISILLLSACSQHNRHDLPKIDTVANISIENGIIHLDETDTDFAGIELRIIDAILNETETKLIINWSNETEHLITFDDSYSIEKEENGEWVSCEIEPVRCETVGYELEPDNRSKKTYDLTNTFDISKDGKYRFSTFCFVFDNGRDAESKRCNLQVEFTITSIENMPKLSISLDKNDFAAWVGSYSWTYTDKDGAEKTVKADCGYPYEHLGNIEAQAVKVTNRDEIPPIAKLNFDIVPDEIKVNAWLLTEDGSIKPFDATVDGFNITPNNIGTGCLYEVVAEWNSAEEYSGTIHYAFYVEWVLANNNRIKKIIDATKDSEITTGSALQVFFYDNKYTYSYPSIKSEYVIVQFENGVEMTVEEALKAGYISISDLDAWDIDYIKK